VRPGRSEGKSQVDCSEWLERILLMVEGSLAEEEARRLEAHLARCPRCRMELELQESILEALKEPPQGELSADFAERTAALAAGAREPARGTPWWLPLVPPLAAACAVAALYGTIVRLAGADGALLGDEARIVAGSLLWAAHSAFSHLAASVRGSCEAAALLGRLSADTPALTFAVASGLAPALWGLRRVQLYLK